MHKGWRTRIIGEASMKTSPQVSPESFERTTVDPPKRVLWMCSLGISTAVLLLLVWQCGSAVYSGPSLADKGVQRFHTEFNRGDYEEICREGDEGFLGGERHDELVRFLELAHRKLGNAQAGTQVNVRVNATTHGVFLTSKYSTQFAQGAAIETFTRRKRGNTLKLYGYNLQSAALLN